MISKIQFLGHSAVFLFSKDLVFAIDPWLQGNPSCNQNLINPSKLDYIILSHGHDDHASDVIRLVKETNAKVIATFELANLLNKHGISTDNLIYMNKGGSINIDNFKVSLTHAYHSSSFKSEYAGEACGIILDDGNNCFYHAGDTALFSDIKLIKELYKPKYGFLPIGDVFTMSPKHAALAAEYLGLDYVIPIHHSTFPLLTGTPEMLKKELNSEIKCLELSSGDFIDL